MPQVFSPGEGETRPLDPTATIYTTAQKVADLLDIGPQEAVLVSADSESDRVYVTGTDYRNTGFSVDDEILIYSDAQAMGTEKTITAIAEGGANGVGLYFTGPFSTSDYQLADNTYVQNTASFTNGKIRGLTKSKVDSIILRMQDQIDNKTHNAWRAYLVNAEYINFDTYKPYRRRYYTDYVGTSPLLFRNVQQILRLELWQGDDYREIGTAEVRLNLPDAVRAISGSIVVAPGNGSYAILTKGTGTGQWRGDFDKVTTAQNLADLINKENRVNKTAVDFFPAFTLEGSTANVAVHNEFLATANSDYGTGIVKITSMRESKGGESCTIVTTDSSIGVAQASGASTFSIGVSSTTINVDNANALENGVTSFDTIVGGTGYTAGTNVTTTGGNGSGCTVDITVTNGVVTGIVLNSPGTNYGVGNVLTISGGNSATFRVSNVSKADFSDAGVCLVGTEVFNYTGKTATSFTGCTNVIGTPLTTLASGTHLITQNKLQIDLHGGSTRGDKGRLRDWWLDSEMGIIYFNNSYPFFEWNAIKVSYIYGERYVDKGIEDICTKMVAIDLLMSDDRSVLIPEGTQNVDLASKIQLYRADIDRTYSRYIEVVTFQ